MPVPLSTNRKAGYLPENFLSKLIVRKYVFLQVSRWLQVVVDFRYSVSFYPSCKKCEFGRKSKE